MTSLRYDRNKFIFENNCNSQGANLTLVNLLLKENIDDYDDEGQNTLSTANTLINEDKKV